LQLDQNKIQTNREILCDQIRLQRRNSCSLIVLELTALQKRWLSHQGLAHHRWLHHYWLALAQVWVVGVVNLRSRIDLFLNLKGIHVVHVAHVLHK